jgi:hypothetical protein
LPKAPEATAYAILIVVFLNYSKEDLKMTAIYDNTRRLFVRSKIIGSPNLCNILLHCGHFIGSFGLS